MTGLDPRSDTQPDSPPDSPPGRAFEGLDLTGARFRRVRLGGARFRLTDLGGALLRDVDLTGAEIDGMIDGLVVNGVEVAPLVRAELERRDPARALIRATDPDGLRAAWAAVRGGWQQTADRVAALPAATAAAAVSGSVEGEWSLVQTLRHLVFATDAWLGAVRGDPAPFHPWGLEFSDLPEFVEGGAAALGLDPAADPSWDEVLALRADRADRVTDHLATITAADLGTEVVGPPWEHGARLPVLTCLHVILAEEVEHRRYAERDLDVLTAA